MWRILTMNHQGVCDGHLQGVWEDLPDHGVFLSKESAISTLRQHIRQNALIKESVSYFDADGEQIP